MDPVIVVDAVIDGVLEDVIDVVREVDCVGVLDGVPVGEGDLDPVIVVDAVFVGVLEAVIDDVLVGDCVFVAVREDVCVCDGVLDGVFEAV